MSGMINGIGGISSLVKRIENFRHREDFNPSEMVDKAFSKLDSQGKGYLDATDFQAALDRASSKASDKLGAGLDQVFSVLDGDADGKVSPTEISDSLQALAESLGALPGMNGAWPPPASEDDAGFSEDELSGQLAELTSADHLSDAETRRTEFLTALLSRFGTADTDGDGRVNADEAMAFAQSSQDTALDASADSSAANSRSDNDAVMRTIMRLMQAYGAAGRAEDASESLSLSG